MIATMGAILMLGAVSADAQEDLDSLLGELTFGESQLVSESDDVATDAADDLLSASDKADEPELLPAPGGEAELAPAKVLPSNPGPPLPDEMLSERLQNLPKNPAPSAAVPMMAPSQGAPMATAPMTMPNAPLANQRAHGAGCACAACGGDAVSRSIVSHSGHSNGQTLVGHHGHAGHGHPGYGHVGHGHFGHGAVGRGHNEHGRECDAPYECRPHVPPTLPGPSSTGQYYRTQPKNSDVWAGYAREAQRRDDHHYRHLRSECDCFKPRQKLIQPANPALYRAACNVQCKGCDVAGCDCQRH
ncbi:MAG: hypothetical protein AAF989_08640 [Planctomycetota bacterium]